MHKSESIGKEWDDASESWVDFVRGGKDYYRDELNKFLIVKGIQGGGHVVGMTGDGINDAPALRQAEVGIAVSNATDVAKKASSAVLTTEGLGGIVDLVKVGRTIFQRIALLRFVRRHRPATHVCLRLAHLLGILHGVGGQGTEEFLGL